MSKKQKLVLEGIIIENFAAEGKCIARHEGEVIFIEGSNVAPGDKVKLYVSKRHKKFAEGRVMEIIEKSPLRVEPFCEHFGTCGGCKWQHIPYEKQLELKWQQVNDQLTRIAKIPLPEIKPIFGSAKSQYYRNKLEFTFSNSRWLTAAEIQSGESFDKNAFGFHIPKRFEKVMNIEHCYLQPSPSNELRLWLRDYVNEHNFTYYDHIAHEGFMRNMMIRTTSTGEVMVVIQFAQKNFEEIEELLSKMYEKFPQITSLNYFINQKRNDSYQDLDVVNFKGNSYIEEEMEDSGGEPLKFRIGVKSFYQTNSEQAYELYKITRDFADLQGDELVYDLYTGTGTIANFVARKAKKVVGLEYVADAIEDAKVNSAINDITNTAFFAGDMKNLLSADFLRQNGKPDVVITDPPRAGMDEPVLRTLLEAAPKTIVYVSCNPATQARDLAILAEKYDVVAIQPVDMFPHTHHVENVAKLLLR